MKLFVDMYGWGDWRVLDEPNTRVTPAQVETIDRLDDVESIGASEVRYGEMLGEICVFHTDGRITSVMEDGTTTTFEEEQ